MFPLLLVNSVPRNNDTSIKSATIIISLWVCALALAPSPGGDRQRLPAEFAEKIDFLLKLLNRATSPEELRAEGIRVHRQAADRRGFSAIEVSANWRMAFRLRWIWATSNCAFSSRTADLPGSKIESSRRSTVMGEITSRYLPRT
ncbi:MAG: hypothetical protein OXC19_14230 [Bryobacterales bacterium]|nr:hypothetical protein [Bryobacterales bacterium]